MQKTIAKDNPIYFKNGFYIEFPHTFTTFQMEVCAPLVDSLVGGK